MGVSMLQLQRDAILETIRNTAQGEWKILIVDEQSRKILDNVLKEDDILNERITNIEEIEQKRPLNKDMDALYILSPLPHIVDSIMADFERRRYRRTFLYWTSILPPQLRERIDRSQTARDQIALFRVMNIDFYPREAQLITFRDPWSLPVLYHPACSNLVRHHMADIAQKIVGVCVSLGEYPTIRYYRPRNPLPTHESHVLSSVLADAIQKEIDTYAHFNHDFPPASNKRSPGTLLIVDRSMDLFAPFVHEFTYQAMAHDLLPVRDGEKVTYRTVLNEGRPDQEEKDMEIGEKDRIWIENRHQHMKDTIQKLMSAFQKFIDDNPHFANQSASNASNLNTIKDMLADLPKFQEMKESYSLHLSMAQDCMNIFQKNKLGELASLEQTLSTGLDEDYKKPKNLADQLVRMLDVEAISPPDRLRLLAMYLLYRDGLLYPDVQKLRLHAQLPNQDEEILRNLELLGARFTKQLRDPTPPKPPLFPRNPPPQGQGAEEYGLSRFEPDLKLMLEAQIRGTLDPQDFPFTKLDPSAQAQVDASVSISSDSLRTAKPTWASARKGPSSANLDATKQRIIVFMAGGATYSEARACYEVSQQMNRDVVLVTSHMLTPGLFLRQLGDLSAERRRLGLPQDAPPKKAPAHLFEKETPPKPPPQMTQQSQRPAQGLPPVPPVGAMSNMKLNGGPPPIGGSAVQRSDWPPTSAQTGSSSGKMKLSKEKDREKDKDKEKKKHGFFSSKR